MGKPSIAMFGEGTVSDDIRLNVPGNILKERGYHIVEKVETTKEGHLVIDEPVDIGMFSRPHVPQAISILKNNGVKIIVDQDDDFWNIPKDHVGYRGIGPGNPSSIDKLNRCLALADVITTSSPVLANLLHMLIPDRPIVILYNGWSKGNPLWLAPRAKTKGSDQFINIGWAGTITHRTDFQQCREAVLKILKNYSNTRIVIGQDLEIYNMFSGVSEDQKLYLPPVPYSLYPTMISHFDILLAPLENNQFNQAKSDIKMVDAGVRKIPYVASGLPAYIRWNKFSGGGHIAYNPQEWYAKLEELVQMQNLRTVLGEQGWVAAQEREQDKIVDVLENIIGELYDSKTVGNPGNERSVPTGGEPE